MENQRDSFIFYRSFFEAIEDLPDENKVEIYSAIGDYSLNYKEPELTGISKTVWTLIKPQLEANRKRYENGTKPKKKQKESKPEAKPKQDISKPEANKNVNENVNVNVNKNKNNNIISKDITTEVVKKDNRVLEIDLIIETLKEINDGIINDTVKKQRQYGKLIKNRLDKLKGFNGEYVKFIQMLYDRSDKYNKRYFCGAEKFYFNIASIISAVKIDSLQAKKGTGITTI